MMLSDTPAVSACTVAEKNDDRKTSALKDFTTLFRDHGQPCDDVQITEIEHQLGRELPDAYRTLIEHTGGGVLSSEFNMFPGDYAPLSGDDGVVLTRILGNGETGNRLNNDLVTNSKNLAGIWDHPREVLIFALTEAGAHECFAINYELPAFPRHSILYIDNEVDDIVRKVADSFEEFIDKLTKNTYYDDQAELNRQSRQKGIEAARYGSLSPSLARALVDSGLDDGEHLLRSLAVKIAQKGFFIVGKDDDSRLLLDYLFWLTTRTLSIENGYSQNPSDDQGRLDDSPTFAQVVDPMICGPGFGFRARWQSGSVRGWWNARIRNGAIVTTDYGYQLSERCTEELFNQLRFIAASHA